MKTEYQFNQIFSIEKIRVFIEENWDCLGLTYWCPMYKMEAGTIFNS